MAETLGGSRHLYGTSQHARFVFDLFPPLFVFLPNRSAPCSLNPHVTSAVERGRKNTQGLLYCEPFIVVWGLFGLVLFYFCYGSRAYQKDLNSYPSDAVVKIVGQPFVSWLLSITIVHTSSATNTLVSPIVVYQCVGVVCWPHRWGRPSLPHAQAYS